MHTLSRQGNRLFPATATNIEVRMQALHNLFKVGPPIKRKAYRCSVCGACTHNCQTCPKVNRKEDRTHPNTIKPGNYVLGE